MCGINGIFALETSPKHDLSGLVDSMNDLVRHRGPDDAGVWEDPTGKVSFGQRRLSIIELSSLGHQPMILPDGTAIVFNGEIYNFRELKKTLPDYPFKSDSDTELILALYKKKGRACVDDLVGMFTIVIWDPKEQGLFIARDRIGKKPFYYTSQGGHFSFSSEIRALLSLPWFEKALDEKAFYQFLTFGFTPPPSTMFEDVYKLEPGHCIWVDSTGVSKQEKYWSVEYEKTPNTEQGLTKGLMEKINRSVDLRMVSDVPVGIFLSGGVDSTGLAAMMRQRTDKPIHSFSISFEDQPDYDEAKDAKATADRLGFTHHERVVTRKDMREMLETIADVLDEPLADPTCIPLYFLSEMAREQKTKVVLTGDGPDELLLGYRSWRPYIKAYPFFRFYRALPKAILKIGTALVGRISSSTRVKEMFHRAYHGQELFWGSAPSFRESEKQRLLTPGFLKRAKNWDCSDIVSDLRCEYDDIFSKKHGSDANWMSFIGLRFVIPNFYMLRADRLGMRHGVELRAPYLDHDLANYSLSIPAKWKVKGGEPKYILKRAFEGIVSKEILYRSKKGFCVPLREWGADIMVDYILENLDDFCDRYDLLDKAEVESQVQKFQDGDIALTSNIWTLYFLFAWMRKWIYQ